METMNIESAQYAVDMNGNNSVITVTINGIQMFIPLDPANRHYAEILRQVEAGTLVILPPDEPEQPEEPST